MRLLFVIDPITKLKPAQDTALAFMAAAQLRGHEVYAVRTKDLFVENGPGARARRLELQLDAKPFFRWLGEPEARPTKDFAAIFMRRDPPFDMDYIFTTYVLSLAQPHSLVINDPRGLRDCNEKAYILRFPELIPPSLMTKNANHIRDFLQRHREAVIKPLDGKGGEGILKLTVGDLNVNSMLELLTRYESRYVMVQKYVPQALQGDKRVLILDGEPVGTFVRIPAGDDLRGNMSVGATVASAELNPRDLEICQRLAPQLAADGIVFAGIDILGPSQTEINVTSPTGVREVKALGGADVAELMIQWVERASLGREKRW